jgi:hypothetical protein
VAASDLRRSGGPLARRLKKEFQKVSAQSAVEGVP